MDNEKIQELLLKLIEDMSYVKAKLDNIDAQKLSSRVDLLEAQAREYDRMIKQLDIRNNGMEQYIKDNLVNSNKANKALWTSIGLAVFSMLLTIISNLII